MVKETKATPGRKALLPEEKVVPILTYYNKGKVDAAGGSVEVRKMVNDFLKKKLR